MQQDFIQLVLLRRMDLRVAIGLRKFKQVWDNEKFYQQTLDKEMQTIKSFNLSARQGQLSKR